MKTYLPDDTTKHRIELIATLFQKGVDAWTEAGQLFVAIIDEHPAAAAYISTTYPALNPALLSLLERVGRNQLHPQLLINDSIGARKLALMPYSIQQLYSAEPVEVVVETETGTDLLRIAIRNLSKDQADQVFNVHTKSVRDAGAQKAWLADRRATTPTTIETKAEPINYEITTSGVTILRPCKLTKAQLKRILDRMP